MTKGSEKSDEVIQRKESRRAPSPEVVAAL